ncbi:MAG: DNA polymerase III subunit alpha, partial [Planctomycetota bacterium]
CRVQDEINTQYQMEALEKIGLLKMDFLGLKNLTIMAKAVKFIKETFNENIELSKIPLDNEKTFKLLQSGKTLGIFQLESEGMSSLLVRLKPDTFEDIIALLALYRPGPLKSGMVDSYVKRKHKMEEVDYLDDSLKDVLEETYGVIVYQEQVMRIANILAGFSMNEADSLRKAMGKKKTEVMAKFRNMFVEGAIAKGIARDKATDIYDKIEFFAGYGFNKSHSTAYGIITYQTAYLKANYPLQFMAAIMTCDASNSDKIAEYRDECKRMGIELLGPDFNESFHDFTMGDKTIRFGLNAIKGMGEKAIESIVDARNRAGGRFTSLQHMLAEVDLKAVNKIALEALIKSGAFDSSGLSRATYAHSLEGMVRWASGVQADKKSGQKGLFGKGDKDLGMIDPPEKNEWEEDLLLSNEKAVLGFYITSDPLKKYAHLMNYLAPFRLSDAKMLKEDATILVSGMITDLRIQLSKTGRNAGKKLALFRLRTLGGNIPAVIFVKEYEKLQDEIVEDAFYIFTGTLDRNREASSPSLIITSICTVDQAIRSKNSIILRIPPAACDSDQFLDEIDALVESSPGPAELYFHFIGNGKKGYTVKAGPHYKVALSESLVVGLENILGRGNVEIR